MSFDWHRRFHGAALDGYRMLTLEERGAYTTILDLIYMRRGPIPDDMKWLAGMFGCTPKQARGLVSRLVRRGKLYVNENGTFMNHRCEDELTMVEELSEKRRRSAQERWGSDNENKHLPDASAMQAPSKSKSPSKVVEASTSQEALQGLISDSQDRVTPTLRVVKP